MQVSTNGVISFGSAYIVFSSRRFPISTRLIAPFWDNSNIEIGGQVLSRLSDNQTLFNKVGSTINDILEFDFTPTILFIATWSGLHYISRQNV